jgi:hypothetical protein
MSKYKAMALILGVVCAGTGCVEPGVGSQGGGTDPEPPSVCPPAQDRGDPFIIDGFIFDPETGIGVSDMEVFFCPRQPGDAPQTHSDEDGAWVLEVPDRDYVWLEFSTENTSVLRAAFDPQVEGRPIIPPPPDQASGSYNPYRLGGVFGGEEGPYPSFTVQGEHIPGVPGTGWLLVDALDPNSRSDINGATVTVSTETTPLFHNSPTEGLQWGNTILDGFDVIYINLPAGPLELDVSFDETPCKVPAPFEITDKMLTIVSAYCD